MNASLSELAKIVQGVVVGDETCLISGLSPIENITKNALVFAEGRENLELAEKSGAAAILVNNQVESYVKPLIRVAHPLKAFIQLINYFYPAKKLRAGIHPTACIAEHVTLGDNLVIGPYVIVESGTKIGDNCIIKGHVTIGADVTIGSNTTLHPHVTLYDRCQVGSRVCIHASSVIGSDGFGYTFVGGEHLKIPHVGHVIIEDDVEIGANTVIDKATLGATVIGTGTKIDNLVQIAHSVKLGKNNILCAFTGIAGSTTSGENVIFAANVGVSDHVRIENEVILGARAGVPPKKHLKKGNIYLGSPARPKEKAISHELSLTRIPIMRKNLQNLSNKVAKIAKHLALDEVTD